MLCSLIIKVRNEKIIFSTHKNDSRTNEKNILLVNFVLSSKIKFSESPNAFDIFDCNNNKASRQPASAVAKHKQNKKKRKPAA